MTEQSKTPRRHVDREFTIDAVQILEESDKPIAQCVQPSVHHPHLGGLSINPRGT